MVRLREDQAVFDVACRRVLLHAVEEEGVKAGIAKTCQRALRMAGRLQTRIGNQQHARSAQFTDQVAKLGERARPKDQAREWWEIEWRQSPLHVAEPGVGGGAGCLHKSILG